MLEDQRDVELVGREPAERGLPALAQLTGLSAALAVLVAAALAAAAISGRALGRR